MILTFPFKGLVCLFSGGETVGFMECNLFHLSSVQNPGWLGYIRDYTTQRYRDYNKPL